MAAEKTTAIVLRVVDFSETSCVVTLMTRDFGKITALAKGARRRKSPFEAALDLLAICRIVFLHKSSGAMDLLTEAKLERRFRSSETSLDRLNAGFYVVELLTALTDEADPHPDLFDLAQRTIEWIDTGRPLFELMLQFELRALKILGHQPMLTECVGCSRKKAREDNRVSFGMVEGGILCPKCRVGRRQIVSLSAEGWRYLRRFADENDELIDEHNSDAEGTKYRGEVRKLISGYITHLLGYRPKLHKYIEKIT